MIKTTTATEEIDGILRSIYSCHPSREDDIKAIDCIKALARRIDELDNYTAILESKTYGTDE